MLHTGARPEKGPGLGYLPARWLDGDLITNALRTLGRQSGAQMLGIGTPQGFLPLRQQLQTRLEELEIGASPRADRDGVRHHAGDRPDLAHLRASRAMR